MTTRTLFKRILTPVLQPLARWYLSKTRSFTYQDIQLEIQPSVFHPALFISTKILLEFIGNQEIENKKFLELGAGSGIVAMLAARKGGIVTASDINPIAVQGIRDNAQVNQIELRVLESDLFDAFLPQVFDFIVINPPYYPQTPKNDQERAFFCGENFDYFHKLFSQLPEFIHNNSRVIMILSEDCAIQQITDIAQSHNFTMIELFRKQVWGEWNFIFVIRMLQI